MKYDFSSLIDRHGMDAIAVDSWGEIPGMAPNAPDEGFDRIPMWVADMNFATVPTVQEHIIQRAQHPMFGYFNPRAEYFDRIIEWQSRRNGVEGLRPEHIGYENGVLGGVVSTLRAYVQPGDAVLVQGASGSGKSTLLHIMGGLDTPSSGEVRLMGQPLKDVSQKDLGLLRNQHLGFVYQFHHLLPEFTALENVKMPLLIGKVNKAEAEKRSIEMLEKVGLGSRIDHRPSELSGGERQRAAIARALVTKPKCLLADEPTGNLDRKNAQNILDMMLDLKNEMGTALVVVTHDDELAVRFDRVMMMSDGRLSDKA